MSLFYILESNLILKILKVSK